MQSATGGVAVALDALMRERGGVWIAHGAGAADRARGRRGRQGAACRPTSPSYALRRLWIDEPTFSAYYGGFANEGLWPLCHLVDVRPKFRSEDWAAYQDVNARFAAAIDEELGRPRRRCSSRTTTWRSWRRRCATRGPTRARRSSGTSRGPTPTGCASVRGVARSSRAAGQRPARVSARARSPQLPAGGRRGARRRGRAEPSRVRFGGRHTTVVVGADWRRLRSHSGDRRRPGAAAENSSGCASCSACVPTSSAWASIGSTTRRAFRSGSRRSTRC